MRASQLDDPLYLPDDDFDAAEPMKPIRFEYLTTTYDLRIQTDMLERLGLVHAFVGRNLYAVNECDSNSLRLTATELLMHEGFAAPSEDAITVRAEQLLRRAVAEQAASFARSALHEMSPEVRRYSQEWRAQADVELAARGVDMKARIAAAVSEFEAA
jgi:hypothetical protein